MKRYNVVCFILLAAILCSMIIVTSGCSSDEYGFMIGTAKVDITPDQNATLAGSPFPKGANGVDLPCYAKAVILSDGKEQTVFVTLDTLKYGIELADLVIYNISHDPNFNIPANRIMITSSHTHSTLYYLLYPGCMVDEIIEAVREATKNMEPCKIGVAGSTVSDISHNRRMLIDGEAWNDWTTHQYSDQKCGPIDTDLQVLAAIGKDGKYKAIFWDYACHAAANGTGKISSDYPGHVQEYLNEKLGYDAEAFFFPGACGDVNPSTNADKMSSALGSEIVKCLGNLEYVAQPKLYVEEKILKMPGRKDPVFQEEEISRKWPGALSVYRTAFNSQMDAVKPTYRTYVCGVRIGNDFAMITDPGEYFCSYGLDIKKNSPFKHTMVVEQTNGAHGYIPTQKDFEYGGYETWFGEHSYLCVEAGDIIHDESINILKDLRKK